MIQGNHEIAVGILSKCGKAPFSRREIVSSVMAENPKFSIDDINRLFDEMVKDGILSNDISGFYKVDWKQLTYASDQGLLKKYDTPDLT